MSRYLKLVHFELNRFANIYLGLMIMTILLQFTGVIVKSNSYLQTTERLIPEYYHSLEDFVREYGKMSFDDITNTLWFAGPIALCIVTLLIYCFLIWYRDWLGKNTFIYRLLMLPTARINIYLSKATAIFLMVLGLVSLQLLLLLIEVKVFEMIVPAGFRADQDLQQMAEGLRHLTILIPHTFTTFVLAYGTGFMAVFVLFTVILFERSFRWKGMAAGILYGIFAVSIFFAPVILETTLNMESNYLYSMEFLAAEVLMGCIVIVMSIWVSHYLLKKKITV